MDQRIEAMATAGRRGTQAIAAGRRVGVTVLFVLLLALLCTAVAQAAPGDLDTTFGLGGETQVPFGGLARAGALALTPDGGSVVAGFTVVPGCGCNEYALARFTAGGVLDPTFGSGGTETLGTTANIAGGVVVEPDESIVVTGSGNGDSTDDIVTKQLNPDGTLDTSFGTGGTSVVNFGADDEAFAMAQQPDGKFVIVGATGTENADGAFTSANFAITRLNADGSLDTSFGTNGKQTVDFGGIDEAEGVAVQPDGKIVVTGFGGALNDLVATRLNADGSLDTSFGTNGRAFIYFNGTAYGGAMALQGDGKILLVGSTTVNGVSQFAVARLTASGVLDPTFNATGELTLAYGPKAEAASVAVQQNGKIVVLGDGGAGQDFIVARLNSDGSQDTSFGNGGTADVDFRLDEEDGSVALQPDGNIVLAGSSGSDDANGNLETGDFAIARLLGDPVTDGGTGGGGTGGGTGGGGTGGGTGGGGTGGGTGGGGTGTGSPTAPPVVKATSTPAPKGPGTVISTQGTTGASRIEVGVGSCKPIFNGPANLPFLNILLPGTATQRICVTAVGPTGATSSTTVSTPVKGTGLPPDKVGPLIQASATPALPTAIAPHAPCDQTMVLHTFIDARGCLILVPSLDNLPAIVKTAVAKYYTTPNLPAWLVKLCASSAPKDKADCPVARRIVGLDTYISYDPVHLDGLTITPRAGLPVVVYLAQNRVFAPFATVTLGPIPLQVGPIDIDMTDFGSQALTPNLRERVTRTAFSFDARQGIPGIGGFPIDAGAELKFATGATAGVVSTVVTLHATLPKLFDVFGAGQQPSGSVVGLADNDHPFSVATADFSIPQASLAGVGFSNLRFHYDQAGNAAVGCKYNYWIATGNLDIGPTGPSGSLVQLTPPPEGNGIEFCMNNFKGAGATVNFVPPVFPTPPELFPGILLNSLNFRMQLNPTVLYGGLTISALDLIKIHGSMVAVFATPRSPFTLTKAEAGPGLDALAPQTFHTTAFGVGGEATLDTPLGPFDLGGAAVLYAYPSFFAANAHVDNLDFGGIFEFSGSFGMAVNAHQHKFEVALNASICTKFIKLCAGGLGIISDRGAVVCLDVHVGAHLRPGVGVSPDGHVTVWPVDGCKPSRYWDQTVTPDARAAAAAGRITFTVARGETVKNIQLAGVGGAPKVLVRGPGGQSLRIDGDGLSHGGVFAGIRSDHYAATWIGIKNGTPGRYTITALPGSVAFGAVSATRPGYDNTFTGHLTRDGGQMVLHYDAARRDGGQRVTFYEDGQQVLHPLVTSTGGTGTVRFTPAPGGGGVRTIVARATVDGAPIRDQTIAHFTFAGTRPAGRPGKVTVRRRGSKLLVSWRRAAGAARYGVVVRLSGGEQETFDVSSQQLHLSAPAPLTESGTISVSAQGGLGDWGPARVSARFSATQRLDSVFRSPLKSRPKSSGASRR